MVRWTFFAVWLNRKKYVWSVTNAIAGAVSVCVPVPRPVKRFIVTSLNFEVLLLERQFILLTVFLGHSRVSVHVFIRALLFNNVQQWFSEVLHGKIGILKSRVEAVLFLSLNQINPEISETHFSLVHCRVLTDSRRRWSQGGGIWWPESWSRSLCTSCTWCRSFLRRDSVRDTGLLSNWYIYSYFDVYLYCTFPMTTGEASQPSQHFKLFACHWTRPQSFEFWLWLSSW